MSGFESGQLGNNRYEIDSLIPGIRAAVRVQLDRAEAEALVRWHRPGIIGPMAEQFDLSDDETFLDALIEAVHAWVATFPLLIPVSVP